MDDAVCCNWRLRTCAGLMLAATAPPASPRRDVFESFTVSLLLANDSCDAREVLLLAPGEERGYPMGITPGSSVIVLPWGACVHIFTHPLHGGGGMALTFKQHDSPFDVSGKASGQASSDNGKPGTDRAAGVATSSVVREFTVPLAAPVTVYTTKEKDSARITGQLSGSTSTYPALPLVGVHRLLQSLSGITFAVSRSVALSRCQDAYWYRVSVPGATHTALMYGGTEDNYRYPSLLTDMKTSDGEAPRFVPATPDTVYVYARNRGIMWRVPAGAVPYYNGASIPVPFGFFAAAGAAGPTVPVPVVPNAVLASATLAAVESTTPVSEGLAERQDASADVGAPLTPGTSRSQPGVGEIVGWTLFAAAGVAGIVTCAVLAAVHYNKARRKPLPLQ